MADTVDVGPSVIQIGVDRSQAACERLASLDKVRRGEGGALPARPAGVVALATCHRLELYLENVRAADAPAVFRRWLGSDPKEERPSLREGQGAARHLLRVAAGLESAVLGEDQILSQLRAAYRDACATRRSGPLLHKLFHAAFRTGRRVRSETGLGAGTRSLAGAAVATLHRRLGGLRDRQVLVLGAGQMGALAARLLAERGVGRLFVANRTHGRAVSLARMLGADAVPWEWHAALLPVVDAVVCATRTSVPVLGRTALRTAAASRKTPLVVTDLGLVPNVERGGEAAIDLYDLDALTAVLDGERQQRAGAVQAAEAIVETELQAWLSWSECRQAMRPAGGHLDVKHLAAR